MKKHAPLGVTAMTIVLLLVPMGGSAHAEGTDVSGVIAQDTTWTTAGSPYHVIGVTEIPDGVTLTIEAGVSVVVDYGTVFLLTGNFAVNGTADSPVLIKGLGQVIGKNRGTQLINNPQTPDPPGATYGVDIKHAVIEGFASVVNGDGMHGYVNISDSLLQDIGSRAVLLRYPTQDSFIDRNTFVRASGIAVQEAMTPDGARLYTRWNRFVSFYPESLPESDWILTLAGGKDEPTIVSGNTFETAGDIAVALAGATPSVGWIPELNAVGNYWGTTDTAVIRSMIWDANDDLNLVTSIPYEPHLDLSDSQVPPPYPQVHSRSVSFSIKVRTQRAVGHVFVSDDTQPCLSGVEIRVQRNIDRVWKTVARGTTGSRGGYAISVRLHRSRYRTLAPASGFGLYDYCSKAVSPVRRDLLP